MFKSKLKALDPEETSIDLPKNIQNSTWEFDISPCLPSFGFNVGRGVWMLPVLCLDDLGRSRSPPQQAKSIAGVDGRVEWLKDLRADYPASFVGPGRQQSFWNS